DDYKSNAKRADLVEVTYETKETKEEIAATKEENKKNIGKLIALDVFEAKDGVFAGSDKLSKEDVIKIINALSDGKFDASKANLSAEPSFAELLRAYLQVLGYPANSLLDDNQLLDKAIAVGIISEDSPL